MTTTTERPPAHATRASNLRLYLIAFLATVYVMAWWLFGARAPATSAELPVTEPAREASLQPRVVAWFDDLPPAQRPAVALPPGWHVAERTAPSSSMTRRGIPVPVRVSPARPGRIRTRSS
jgi:hypothetical protein